MHEKFQLFGMHKILRILAAHGNEISGGARTFGSVPVGIEDSVPAENLSVFVHQ